MSQMLRFILLIALIAAVSVGVYYWFEEQQTGVEKAADELEERTDELRGRKEEPERRQPAPERPS